MPTEAILFFGFMVVGGLACMIGYPLMLLDRARAFWRPSRSRGSAPRNEARAEQVRYCFIQPGKWSAGKGPYDVDKFWHVAGRGEELYATYRTACGQNVQHIHGSESFRSHRAFDRPLCPICQQWLKSPSRQRRTVVLDVLGDPVLWIFELAGGLCFAIGLGAFLKAMGIAC